MVKVKKDLTGQRFGRLVVVKQAEDYISKDGTHYAQWYCKCDCDVNGTNLTIVRDCSLKNGRTQSCGCIHKEVVQQTGLKNKQHNKYDLNSFEYGVGYTSKGEEFWFDKEDYDLIKDFYWYYSTSKSHYGYVVTNHYQNIEKQQVTIQLHRLVMFAEKGEYVDHIVHGTKDELKFDNRKSNLRILSNMQNCWNHHLHSNNTSGVSGVTWSNSRNKWYCRIVVNYQEIVLGYFDDFDEAVRVRKEAEEKYYGEYSFDNSQKLLDEEKGD